MGPSAQLENLWEIRDCLWEKIQPVLLAADPPKATGRKRVDQRRLLNGIVYKLRSGCQWNHLPKELGDDSTIHRTFQRWMRLGVFVQVWAMLAEDNDAGLASGLTAPAAGPEAWQENTVGGHRQRAG